MKKVYVGLSADLIHPGHINILKEAKKREDRRVIEIAVLRSMRLAAYSSVDAGHFGLALESYTHFTSPIRRYPDLLVHRQIKANIARKTGGSYPNLQLIAKSTSDCERRAEAAEREVLVKSKMVLEQSELVVLKIRYLEEVVLFSDLAQEIME